MSCLGSLQVFFFLTSPPDALLPCLSPLFQPCRRRWEWSLQTGTGPLFSSGSGSGSPPSRCPCPHSEGSYSAARASPDPPTEREGKHCRQALRSFDVNLVEEFCLLNLTKYLVGILYFSKCHFSSNRSFGFPLLYYLFLKFH